MTWPFENDTSAIVKKLADRSMKADKRRNAFIIITIAFAVSLMMVLALYNLGTDRENRLYLQGRYQGSFINSTSTVFEKLEHNNQIEAVGKEAAMGTSRINDYTLDVYYRDQNALELKGVTDLLGKMPEAENEIIVEQSYLEHLGLPVQLDQTVTLDMPFGKNQTYHVCGIIQSSNAFRKNPRQVLTRGQLLEKLWDIDEKFVDEHTLTTSISRIRSKIESDGGAPYIKTVYGMGYQWTGGEAK